MSGRSRPWASRLSLTTDIKALSIKTRYSSSFTGDQLQGYIQNIRPDGKIDVSLQPVGRQQTEDFAETLLQYLKNNSGVCELGDKSDAEAIYRQFHVSKKVYKRAVGDLYKRRLIAVEPTRVKLV